MESLRKIAFNLWFSWNFEALELFKELDPALWEECGHSPVKMLRLIKQSRRKVFLIVDGHPAHRAKRVREWLEEHAERIEMFFLPGYAPDLNPDELVNGDLKRAVGQVRPRDREAMKAATRKWLHRRQKQPAILANFSNEPHVRYAAA